MTPAIVITGASSGIGREIARVAASERQPLLLVARSNDILLELVREFDATGTHQAELQGIPPTGKKITVLVCDVVTTKDGKVLSEREYYDQLGMMQQLGVIPTE